MAKEIVLSRSTDTPELLPGCNLPELSLVLATKAGDAVTRQGGGIEIVNMTRTFRLIDAEGYDGKPADVTVVFSILRSAGNEHEAKRIEDAKTAQKTNSEARKLQQATERMEAIQIATTTNVARFKEGVETGKAMVQPAPTVNVAEQAKAALELASVLHSLLPKSLPAGQ